MKGFVLTLRNNSDRKIIRLPDIKQHSIRLRTMLSRYGLQAVFAVLFLCGLIAGAASDKRFERSTFDQLDLLFISNIDARTEMSVPDIFISCFVSYFVFIFCAFLCGLSAWGFSAVPLLTAVKGFTVGLSSAFIFSQYRLSGIGFYILVILPGTVLFLFALIRYSSYSFQMSLRYAGFSMFHTEQASAIRDSVKQFLKRSFFALLSAVGCSVLDMTLWLLFADKFEFS